MEAAQDPAQELIERVGTTSNHTLTEDWGIAAARAAAGDERAVLAKAQAVALALLPTQWKGRVYRRREVPMNPTQREDAELAKLLRWSQELLGLLLEAKGILPFVASADKAKGGADGASVLRCCRSV